MMTLQQKITAALTNSIQLWVLKFLDETIDIRCDVGKSSGVVKFDVDSGELIRMVGTGSASLVVAQ